MAALTRAGRRLCRHYKALAFTFQNHNIAAVSAPKGGLLGRPFCSVARERAELSEWKKYAGYVVLLVGCGAATYYTFPYPEERRGRAVEESEPQSVSVSNWSGTHEVEVQSENYLQPESLEELERMVREADRQGRKLRPVGSGLSPNGIGLNAQGMVNLALMDKVLHVDTQNNTVRLQPGVTVSNLVDYLRPYGLTLQNFASIREQQIGGFTQVGAHGTGARLPPVDEQVVSLKLVTPAKGTIDLSAEKDPELFYLSRCGLGGLGIVAELTLQCVPRHRLVEHTFVSNIKGVQKNHKKWLSENKHLRYMWIPYTDTIVVVQSNPLPDGEDPPKFSAKYGKDEALKHFRDLYKELEYRVEETNTVENNDNKSGVQVSSGAQMDVNELSFAEFRDKLLSFNPLNKDHVMKVNLAEAEYWKKSEGYRVGWSDEILGFDCGGQQWVSEVCFPVGTLRNPNLKDISYLEEAIKLIKNEKIPAPAPIEQRWTASSRSLMSPASSSDSDALFSWVGIIMYMPTMDSEQRKAITSEFFKYRRAAQKQLWDKYSAYEHWAKIEIPENDEELSWLRQRIKKRFPVDAYKRAQTELDPNHILSNNILEKLFPHSE